MVRFDNEKYRFATTDGPMRLSDFFEGRQQLALYQFMDNGPDAFCPGCTHLTANVTDLTTLADEGVSWRTVSNMPLAQMQSYWATKGWSVPFASSRDTTFSDDCGRPRLPTQHVLHRRRESTAPTRQCRGSTVAVRQHILDLAPYGRQEEWRTRPGWPQHPTYG